MHLIKKLRKIKKLPEYLKDKALKFLDKYFFWPMAWIFGQELLQELTPYDVKKFEQKIRLGNLYDGGYVLPENILPLVEVVYTYGVSNFIDFEEDLIRRVNIPIRLYDHTVNNLPVKNKNFFFKKEGIAEKKHDGFDTFENHLKENGDMAKKIFLKIDIEGTEWKIMPDIISKFFDNIIAIILEIHSLGQKRNFKKYVKVLNKINSKFTLVHIHGNNCCGTINLKNKKLPRICELTFLNNNFVKEKSVINYVLPSKIDYPNIKGREDIKLDFWQDKYYGK